MDGTRLWPGGPLFQDAAVRGGEKGADLGCGSGLLMMLLLRSESVLHMAGLEIQPEALRLAEENLRINGLLERAELVCGDLRETVKRLPNGGFDFVISNPPYFPPESGRMPPDGARETARGETALKLPELCAAASRLCRSGGRIFLCHRPERLVSLLQEMRAHHLEPKRIRFVHHDLHAPASLLLVEGRKDGKPGFNVEAPFLIRGENGAETEEYRRICHRD